MDILCVYVSLYLNVIQGQSVDESRVANSLEANKREIIMIIDAFTIFGALLAILTVAALFYADKLGT